MKLVTEITITLVWSLDEAVETGRPRTRDELLAAVSKLAVSDMENAIRVADVVTISAKTTQVS